jgi:hypothetical protein
MPLVPGLKLDFGVHGIALHTNLLSLLNNANFGPGRRPKTEAKPDEIPALHHPLRVFFLN